MTRLMSFFPFFYFCHIFPYIILCSSVFILNHHHYQYYYYYFFFFSQKMIVLLGPMGIRHTTRRLNTFLWIGLKHLQYFPQDQVANEQYLSPSFIWVNSQRGAAKLTIFQWTWCSGNWCQFLKNQIKNPLSFTGFFFFFFFCCIKREFSLPVRFKSAQGGNLRQVELTLHERQLDCNFL